jgi:transcriptional regulator with XRE-family HTH domain
MIEERTRALKVVGAYVRTLRTVQRITRSEVETALSISSMTLTRLENGDCDVRSSSMMALVRHLGGSLDEVADLQFTPHMTEEHARQIALRRVHTPLVRQDDQLYGAPTTAFAVFLHRLRKVSKNAKAAWTRGRIPLDPFIELRIRDADIWRADVSIKTVFEMIEHLKDLGASADEIHFLLTHPDLPAACGDCLAAARLGIGDVERIMATYAPCRV